MQFKKSHILLFIAVNLAGRLYGQVDKTMIDTGWQFKQAQDSVWLKATVPGCVHTDLMNGSTGNHLFSTGKTLSLNFFLT